MNKNKWLKILVILVNVLVVVYLIQFLRARQNEATENQPDAQQNQNDQSTQQTQVTTTTLESDIAMSANTNTRSPNFAQAQQDLGEKLYAEISKHPGKWELSYSEDGRFDAIMGGNIPDIGRSPQALDQWIQKIEPLFDFPEYVDLAPSKQEAIASLSKSFTVQQMAKGYEVYEGGLLVTARNDDNSVFLFSSYAKDVGDFDNRITFTQDEAWLVVQLEYQGKSLKLLSRKDQPVVFASRGPQTTELAWQFDAEMTNDKLKREARRILVGIPSRSIISRDRIGFN